MLTISIDVRLIQLQLMAGIVENDLLAAGKDFMTAVLLIPLGERCGHVHFLDDIAPAHAGVIGAEADLALLRGVRNDALLGAAEVIVIQVLEPHTGDKQEVPAVLAAPLDIFDGAVPLHAAILLVGAFGGPKSLVKLLQQVHQFEVGGGLVRIVVAQQGQRHAKH